MATSRLRHLVNLRGYRGAARTLTEAGHPTAESTVRFALEGRTGRSKASQQATRSRLEASAAGIDLRRVRDPGERVIASSAPSGRAATPFNRPIGRGGITRPALRIGQADTTDRQGKTTRVVRRQLGRPTVEMLIHMSSAAYGGGANEWAIAFYGTWRYPHGQEHLDRAGPGGKGKYPLALLGAAGPEDAGPGGVWHRGWYSARHPASSVSNAVAEINRDIQARITLEPRQLQAKDEAERIRHIKMGNPKDPMNYPTFAQRLANELTGVEWASVTSMWIGEAYSAGAPAGTPPRTA